MTFNRNQYSQAPIDKGSILGKFQFCIDEKCTAGRPINPGHDLYIRDLHGSLANASDAGQWLNKAAEGAYISRDPSFANAGKFSTAKWSCGKYCLTGFKTGIGQACPVNDAGITFYSRNSQACAEYHLVEIPCNVRSDKNNCLWTLPEEETHEKDESVSYTAGERRNGA